MPFRSRRQPKTPRRAILAGSPHVPEPVEPTEAPKSKKRTARKRTETPEVVDE